MTTKMKETLVMMTLIAITIFLGNNEAWGKVDAVVDQSTCGRMKNVAGNYFGF